MFLKQLKNKEKTILAQILENLRPNYVKAGQSVTNFCVLIPILIINMYST